jgi:spore coat protein CotH
MHERLAYWVARQAGVPASRDNHALLTVNGRFYGLYSNLETVKKRLMKQLFGDGDGTLYSTQDVELIPGDVPDFTIESGPDDRMLLAGLANALTASSGDEAMAGAADYADVAEFTRYWAVCAVVAQLDAFPYSNPGDDYFLYADPVTHRLFFLPWGADETFYSSSHDVTQVFSVMARKCKDSPGCYRQFISQTMEVLTLVEQLDWLGETDRIVAQIAPFTVMDTNKWYTNDDVARHQRSMRHFVSERRARLLPMLR